MRSMFSYPRQLCPWFHIVHPLSKRHKPCVRLEIGCIISTLWYLVRISMKRENEFSRRNFLAAAGALASASRMLAADAVEKEKLPVIAKRVEKAFEAPCKEPNDLQFVSDG